MPIEPSQSLVSFLWLASSCIHKNFISYNSIEQLSLCTNWSR